MSIFIKAPNAVLDYMENWNDGWLSDGEEISSSSWTVPSGITKDSDTYTGATATIWVSGGTHGQEYICTNHITTDAGRTDERSFKFIVRNR